MEQILQSGGRRVAAVRGGLGKRKRDEDRHTAVEQQRVVSDGVERRDKSGVEAVILDETVSWDGSSSLNRGEHGFRRNRRNVCQQRLSELAQPIDCAEIAAGLKPARRDPDGNFALVEIAEPPREGFQQALSGQLLHDGIGGDFLKGHLGKPVGDGMRQNRAPYAAALNKVAMLELPVPTQ